MRLATLLATLPPSAPSPTAHSVARSCDARAEFSDRFASAAVCEAGSDPPQASAVRASAIATRAPPPIGMALRPTLASVWMRRTCEASDEFGRRRRSHGRLSKPNQEAQDGRLGGWIRLALSKANVDRYLEVATTAGGRWIEHGALDYKECLADDVQVGELTSFPRSVVARPGARGAS